MHNPKNEFPEIISKNSTILRKTLIIKDLEGVHIDF